MTNKHTRMKLFHDEESYLLHWIYDEAHYLKGRGPAKELQLRNGALPADLAILIAASMPDPADQGAAGVGPPPDGQPSWPWSEETFQARLAEARAVLATRSGQAPLVSQTR